MVAHRLFAAARLLPRGMIRPNERIQKLKDMILRKIVVHLDLLKNNRTFALQIILLNKRKKDHVA